MTTVQLWRRRPEDGIAELLATITAPEEGGPAVIQPATQGITTDGIRLVLSGGAVGRDGRTLHLADGQEFVEALPETLRGTRLWAELED